MTGRVAVLLLLLLLGLPPAAAQIVTGGGQAGALLSANNLSDVASAAASRTNLGLGAAAVIGTPIAVANGGTGTGTAGATAANNIGALAEASNLSDLNNASTARTNLGLGALATEGAVTLAQMPSLSGLQAYCNTSTSSGTPSSCHTLIHSLDYATGNGSTDDTTALQNWINACESGTTFLCVYDIPSSCYKTSSALSITSAIYLLGPVQQPGNLRGGTTNGSICMSSATQDGIDVNVSVSSTSVTIQGIPITSSTTPTSGSCLSVTGSTTAGNFGSFIENDFFGNCWTGITMGNSSWFGIKHTVIFRPQHDCAELQAWGDSSIEESVCVRLNTVTTNNGILLTDFSSTVPGGGIRLINNKFNGPDTATSGCAIILDFGTSESSSPSQDIIVSDNSLEGFASGVCLTQGALTLQFANVAIHHNEIQFNVSAVSTDTNTDWLERLVIDHNIMAALGSTASTAISLASAPAGFLVDANYIDMGSQAAGCVSAGSGATNGVIAGTQCVNSTATTLISAASSSVRVFDANGVARSSLPTTVQNGSSIYDTTVNATDDFLSNTPLVRGGALFSATASVTTSGTGANALISSTGVGTSTLPSNLLTPGKTIKITLTGTITTAASPGTLTFAVTLGGTSVAASAATTPTANASNLEFTSTMWITCRTTGSGGTVFAQGNFQSVGALTVGLASTAATSINTTTSQAISVTSTNGTSGGAVLTVTNALIEVID
jgi:hypothetical protein